MANSDNRRLLEEEQASSVKETWLGAITRFQTVITALYSTFVVRRLPLADGSGDLPLTLIMKRFSFVTRDPKAVIRASDN